MHKKYSKYNDCKVPRYDPIIPVFMSASSETQSSYSLHEVQDTQSYHSRFRTLL